MPIYSHHSLSDIETDVFESQLKDISRGVKNDWIFVLFIYQLCNN